MSDASVMRHIDEHLAAYTAGELSDEETARVERHLAECPRCRAMLAETRRIRTLLGALASDGDAIPSVAAQVKAALRAENGESPAPQAAMDGAQLQERMVVSDKKIPRPSPERELRVRPPLWVSLVAASVLVVLSALIFSRFSVQPGQTTGILTPSVIPASITPQGSPTPSPLPSNTPPAGWRQILKDVRFSGNAGEQGITASLARRGRIAGCALPSATFQPGIPNFMLSDDGGATWKTSAIPGIGPLQTCSIVADTKRADTFVVGGDQSGTGGGRYLFVTEDAGHIWRALPTSPMVGFGLYSGGHEAAQLVDGRLIGIWMDQPGKWRLEEMTLDGVLHPLDSAFPFESSPIQIGIQNFTVDPRDPMRIYAARYAKEDDATAGILLYRTTNGGGSWTLIKQWRGYNNLSSLWIGPDGVIYYNKTVPTDAGGNPLYWSTDGGASWRNAIPPQLSSINPNAIGYLAISPQGRVIAVNDQAYLFDRATGKFNLLASVPDPYPGTSWGVSVYVILDAPVPTLLGTGLGGTYLYRLP
jgi:photosystem II stability/assembly factor-like uncharacterized protein